MSHSEKEAKGWPMKSGYFMTPFTARRSDDGNYILVFPTATVELTPAELVNQEKSLAKLAGAGISVVFATDHWGWADWYRLVVGEIIYVCSKGEKARNGGEG